MTRLRKMLLDELERRKYSQNTRRLYVHAVSECAQYFHCTHGPAMARSNPRLPSAAFPGTQTKTRWRSAHTWRHCGSFLSVILKRAGHRMTSMPRNDRIRCLWILWPDRVAQLINAAASPVHRILLMTLYATGMRRAESL